MNHRIKFLLFFVTGCFADPTPVSTDTGTSSSGDDTTGSTDTSSATTTTTDTSSTDGANTSDDATSDEGSFSSSSGGGGSQALYFDGNDEASSAAIAHSTLPPEFTVELWVNLEDEYYGVLIDARDLGVDDGWILNLNRPEAAIDPNTLRLGWVAEDASVEGLTGPEINDLAPGWHHWAFTRDANGLLRFWLDGVSVAEGPSEMPPAAQVTPISVGRYRFGEPRTTLWWRGGALDDIHISSVAPTTETFTPEPAEVDTYSVLLWHFDEGAGDVAVDEVAGVELTLMNPAWAEGY